MKQVVFFLFSFLTPVLLFAQQSDSDVIPKKDSVIKRKVPPHPRKDSLSIQPIVDSAISKPGQDSLINTDPGLLAEKDTGKLVKKDTVINRPAAYITALQKILQENRFLNWAGKPVAMTNQVREAYNSDNFFYVLLLIGMLFGFFRFFYTRYFNNLFRVFFNASLRQSQLTDQLLQAKLPALFFNILFILTGGLYVYLLLLYYNWISPVNFWLAFFYCTLCLGVIYLIKLITVKFTGWLTGYKEVTNTYVFIIFLINKILGILLLPLTIIIAFAMPAIGSAAVIISLFLVGLMFLLRFFRSYGLLEHKLKISRFHFLMYVAGVEILPVLLIYKGLILLLGKNL